jgi:hypothetical protein
MDRRWWLRLALAAIVVAFVLLIGRATMIAFSPEHKRLDRAEQQLFAQPAPSPPPPAAAEDPP